MPLPRSPLLTPALLALAVSVLVVLPGGPGLPGHPTVDVWTHAWGLHWVATSLAAFELPVETHLLAWPRGGSVTPADPLGGVLLAPVTLLLGAGAGYLAQVVLQLWVAVLGGWAYGHALGGPRPAALVAVACATAPTFLAEVHNGILEAHWLGLVALAAAAAVKGHRLTPLAVALAALATPYHGVSALTLAAAHLVAGRRWGLLGATVAAALAAVGLATAGLRAGLNAPVPLEIKPPGIQDATLRINAVDPLAFFRPGDHWTVKLDGVMETDFRRTPYLGWALLLAGLWGAARRRGWLALGVVAVGATLALGPYLWWGRDFYRTAEGHRLALPLLPVLKLTDGGLDHPLRFLGMSVVALAGLAGLGAGRWAPWLAGVVLVENLLVAPNVWPLAKSPAAIPAVYAALPDDGRAVIDLPAQVGNTMRTGAWLYYQTAHGRPIPYTLKPSARVPNPNGLLRGWLALSAPSAVGPAPDLGPPPAEPLVDLARAGFGWVVLHPQLCRGTVAVNTHRLAVSRALGEPREIAGAYVWEIPAP